MAQSTTTRSGIVLKIPGTYVEQQVISGQGGLGLSGVLVLVGEAEEGPHWSETEDLSAFAYRPDQLGAAQQAFGAGNLIDGMRAAIAANTDPTLAGSVNLVYLVKTNTSSKSSRILHRSGFPATYAEITARRAGKPGNSISVQNKTAQAEQAPTVSQLALCLSPTGSSTVNIRINGGTELSAILPQISAQMPVSLVVNLESLESDGLLTQGGTPRNILPEAGETLSLAASGADNVIITLSSGAWATNPQIGDVLIIHTGSSLAGTADENVGSYRVLSATTTTVTAQKINVIGPTADPVAGAVQGTGLGRAVDTFTAVTISNATGMDRNILDGVVGNITSSAFTASQVRLQLDPGTSFTAEPRAGELVYVPTTFVNVLDGWYQVVSVSNVATGELVLNRLSNGALTNLPGSTAAANQLQAFKADIDGLGKSMELLADTDAQNTIRKSNTGTSAPELNTLVVSASEKRIETVISKPSALNPITDTFISGGDVVIAIGYNGASCSLIINDETLTTNCSNVNDNLEIDLADFPTARTLTEFIDSLPAYTATVVDSRFSSLSPVRLDNLSCEAASSLNQRPARIKKDADNWFNQVNQSGMVTIPTYATTGLPDSEANAKFLTGGAKGATNAANVIEAIDACETVNTNFLIPLFDKDASDDIAESKTDAASTYQIDTINTYAKAHAISMSGVKSRKNRSAFVAKDTSYTEAKKAARDLSHPRVVMAFNKVKDVASDGSIKTFPAWAQSCKTAGLTAVAGYKGIVKKFVSMSGAIYPAGFDPRKRGDLEDALDSGLTIVEPVPTGGFRFVSDQTTYNIDNNFVFNSIQAVYLADLVTLTLIQNADRVIVGKSVAQMSAAIARGFIQTEMDSFLRLNFIARSDDAPLGYKNLSVNLSGGVIEINVEVKLAGIIYFVPINLSLSEATQTA